VVSTADEESEQGRLEGVGIERESGVRDDADLRTAGVQHGQLE
jgi:hypothetical protein